MPVHACSSSRQSTPLISVVILNYNGERFIRDCLDSVLADDYYPKEILLVDNASRDGSLKTAREYQNRGVTVIENEANFGFPKGCNRGIALARGDVIVLLNIDTIVRPGWLRHLASPLNEDAAIGVVVSKLLFFDGETIQYAGGGLSPNGLTYHDGYGEKDDAQFDRRRDTTYATGASVAIRVDLLDRLGGLDEKFPLYFEDVDFSLRAQQAGYRVVYQPESVVLHYESFGSRKRSWRYYYNYHRGRIRLILKQFGVKYFMGAFMRAEWDWYFRCDLRNQLGPLLCAYASQLPKAPWFWARGWLRRRNYIGSSCVKQ